MPASLNYIYTCTTTRCIVDMICVCKWTYTFIYNFTESKRVDPVVIPKESLTSETQLLGQGGTPQSKKPFIFL